MNKINKKVYIGLSGGVDSSVSAALLLQEGYDVTGVFIKVWQPDWINCTWKEDRLDAMRVCAKLGIPFITLDLEKEYKEEVVDYMIREYKQGRTPNPDVMCNRYVKFGGFYNWAMKQGAHYVATGHYARVREEECEVVIEESLGDAKASRVNASLASDDMCSERTTSHFSYKLLAGIDLNKDQTYFLWTLSNEQLSRTLFPVGDIEKPEVRKLAKKFGLSTATKKDSQGLCFIGKIDVKEFLSHYIEEKKGDVLDENGKVIGVHNGATFLTIGERHGFKITKKTPNDKPYFVISKDIKNNTITVANKDIKGNLPNATYEVQLINVNWNQGVAPIGKKLKARSRYREALQDIEVLSDDRVKFDKPQNTLTLGQSLVVYDGEECLGGGIIDMV